MLRIKDLQEEQRLEHDIARVGSDKTWIQELTLLKEKFITVLSSSSDLCKHCMYASVSGNVVGGGCL